MPEGNIWSGSTVPTPARESGPAEGRLLSQPMRRRILDLIKREPGIKISQLCKSTDAGWGTVKYHLHLLKRAGLVQSRSTGRDCLLFVSDFPAEEVPITEALRRGRASSLAAAISQTPGASQKQLCEQVRMTRKIFRRYVELLSNAGLVTERREAQFQRYYPDPRLARHLPTAPPLAPPAAPAEPAPPPTLR